MSERYDRGAIGFHWSMALLFVVVGVLGLLHDSWPRATQSFWINCHALLGLLLWVLLMAQFGWRAAHPPPPLPAAAGELSRRLSRPVHLLIYLLLFVTPIIGIVTFIWHGRVFDFGVFRVDFGVAKNRAVFHPTEEIHMYLAYALFTLAGLHALAALWHQFIRRDGLLARMWP
ncbi:MAG TPA: cytochrome b/b6 domain-containing protein [Steroidobacteraceae bacterium]|nr:cytochrome b/b6 domain-containing protein [Steroidobacteraceae bacterium]